MYCFIEEPRYLLPWVRDGFKLTNKMSTETVLRIRDSIPGRRKKYFIFFEASIEASVKGHRGSFTESTAAVCIW
jgi:hypothetical protein